MTIDGVEYIQVQEKHYKSCEGCAFESQNPKGKCDLKTRSDCEHRIWIKR